MNVDFYALHIREICDVRDVRLVPVLQEDRVCVDDATKHIYWRLTWTINLIYKSMLVHSNGSTVT